MGMETPKKCEQLHVQGLYVGEFKNKGGGRVTLELLLKPLLSCESFRHCSYWNFKINIVHVKLIKGGGGGMPPSPTLKYTPDVHRHLICLGGAGRGMPPTPSSHISALH